MMIEIAMIVLISMVVAFLYFVITEYFKNSYIDGILFLSLLISHLICFTQLSLSGIKWSKFAVKIFQKKRSQ